MTWFGVVATHLFFYQNTPFLEQHNFFILIGLGAALPVLHILLIYLYCDALQNKLSIKRMALHLSIYLTYAGVFSYYSAIDDLDINGLKLLFSKEAPLWCKGISPSFLVVYVVYSIQIFQLIKGVKFKLRQFYSNEEITRVQWLNLWILSYLIMSVMIVLSILGSDFDLISEKLSFISVETAMSVQVFVVGQLGLNSKFRFPETVLINTSNDGKYKASGLKKDALTSLKTELINIIETDRLYLNQDLSISDVARRLGIPVYQASQLINEGFKKTFFDLVNDYRIEEFKQRLEDESYNHLTLLGIAFDCGFNSKSGFYKTFKSFTGMSPSQYKKKFLKK